MIKTAMLMAAMTALFGFAGAMLGGFGGLVIALLVAVAMNVFAWYNSDKMVLRMYGAKEVSKDHPLYEMVADLSLNAQLPTPKVYEIQSDQPNAFATGRNPENAAVAATTGLLKRLNKNEIAAVMAHELAHIKNRDTTIMVVAATFAGAISMLANFAMFFTTSIASFWSSSRSSRPTTGALKCSYKMPRFLTDSFRCWKFAHWQSRSCFQCARGPNWLMGRSCLEYMAAS